MVEDRFSRTPSVSKTQVHPIDMPSPSMHEGIIGDVAPGDYTMQLVAEALRVVRVAAEGARKSAVAIYGDLTLSEAARHVKANEISYKITNRCLPLVDRANENLQTEITRLKGKTSAPAVDNTLAAIQVRSEIRVALRAMPPADRRKAIMRAIEQNDDSVISAILGAPVMLTDLSPAEVEGFRAQWQAKRFPDEMARIDQLERRKFTFNAAEPC